MRAWGLAALLALAGCGGGDAEDFSVEVKRPIPTVYVPLSSVDLREARQIFTGITVDRTRPSDSEILYTIPSTGAYPTTIRFKLEPRDDRAGTVVRAFVRVPPIEATIDGRPQRISEHKVELALQAIVRSIARSLEMGSSASAESAKLSLFLASIAVATDKDQLARVLELKKDPARLASVLLAFGAPGHEVRQPEPSVEGREIRALDPDSAQDQRELAQTHVEWTQDQAIDRAAEPASDLERYDN